MWFPQKEFKSLVKNTLSLEWGNSSIQTVKGKASEIFSLNTTVETKDNLSFKKVSKANGGGKSQRLKEQRTQRGTRHKNWRVIARIVSDSLYCHMHCHKAQESRTMKSLIRVLPETINHKYLLHYFSEEMHSFQVLIQYAQTHTHTQTHPNIYTYRNHLF